MHLCDLRGDNNGIIRKDNSLPANKILDFYVPSIESLLKSYNVSNISFPVFDRIKLDAAGKFLDKEGRKGTLKRATVSQVLEISIKNGIREYMENKEIDISEDEINKLWILQIPDDILQSLPSIYFLQPILPFYLITPK